MYIHNYAGQQQENEYLNKAQALVGIPAVLPAVE